MAINKKEFTNEQMGIIGDALDLYKGEVIKLMKKSDKLGLSEEVETFKKKFLEVEAIRNKVSGE